MNLVPTASTTAALALGDALALTLSVRKGFREEHFASLHPGGKLGKRLMRVEHVMQGGDAAPRVHRRARMPEIIHEMSSKRLGMTTVVDDDGRLAGVFTDGDLRRLFMSRPPNMCFPRRRRRHDEQPAHGLPRAASPSKHSRRWRRTRSPPSSSSTNTVSPTASSTCTICGARR